MTAKDPITREGSNGAMTTITPQTPDQEQDDMDRGRLLRSAVITLVACRELPLLPWAYGDDVYDLISHPDPRLPEAQRIALIDTYAGWFGAVPCIDRTAEFTAYQVTAQFCTLSVHVWTGVTLTVPGHPAAPGAGYDCACGECLALPARRAGVAA